MIPSRRRSCRRAIQTRIRPLPTDVNSRNSPTIVDLAKESLSYGRFSLSYWPLVELNTTAGATFPTDSAMVCGYRSVTLFRLLDS